MNVLLNIPKTNVTSDVNAMCLFCDPHAHKAQR